jgi:hypothetical protein
MPRRIYEDDNFGGYEGYFPDPAVTNDLGRYDMGYFLADWNDEVSSLKTTTSLRVFQDVNFQGDYVDLPPGDHTLAELNDYGVANDSISSFMALA